MKAEEGWRMYIDTKHLKLIGFSNSKIAQILEISRLTVIKYGNMEPEEFNREMNEQKSRKN